MVCLECGIGDPRIGYAAAPSAAVAAQTPGFCTRRQELPSQLRGSLAAVVSSSHQPPFEEFFFGFDCRHFYGLRRRADVAN